MTLRPCSFASWITKDPTGPAPVEMKATSPYMGAEYTWSSYDRNASTYLFGLRVFLPRIESRLTWHTRRTDIDAPWETAVFRQYSELGGILPNEVLHELYMIATSALNSKSMTGLKKLTEHAIKMASDFHIRVLGAEHDADAEVLQTTTS